MSWWCHIDFHQLCPEGFKNKDVTVLHYGKCSNNIHVCEKALKWKVYSALLWLNVFQSNSVSCDVTGGRGQTYHNQIKPEKETRKDKSDVILYFPETKNVLVRLEIPSDFWMIYNYNNIISLRLDSKVLDWQKNVKQRIDLLPCGNWSIANSNRCYKYMLNDVGRSSSRDFHWMKQSEKINTRMN